MFYSIVRPFMVFFMLLYYKRIYYHGLKGLDPKKGILLASNHPNAFMDALMLAVFVDRQINSLARGDVFKTRIARFFLSLVNILPIFRRRDGVENMYQNRITFDKCIEFFKLRSVVLIFSEGLCIAEKRLRKLKRGTAQLALETYFDHQTPLSLVPVGINYTAGQELRKEVMVNLSAPIDLEPYRDLYAKNKTDAITKLNEELRERLEKEVIHINNHSEDEDVEFVLHLFRRKFKKRERRGIIQNRSRFEMEKTVVDAYNRIEGTNNFQKLKLSISELKSLLNKHSLKIDKLLRPAQFSIPKFLILVLLSPLAILFILPNFPPIALAILSTRRIVKAKEFFASLYYGFGFLFYWIYHNLIVLIVWINLGLLSASVVFFMLPFLGYWGLNLLEGLQNQFNALRFHRKSKKHQEDLGRFSALSGDIIQMLELEVRES